MLIVKAIQDKAKQEEYCKECGAAYDEEFLAYSAFEDDNLIGICQFSFGDGVATIHDLRNKPTVNDYEGMFILARGALNFIDLAGTHMARCTANAGEKTLIKSVGFHEIDGNLYEMDLTGAFSGNCSGCKK